MKNQKTLLPCWWENELVQNHVEKLSGKFLVKQMFVMTQQFWPYIYMGQKNCTYIHQKNVPNNVHSSTFHNDPN